MPTMSTINYFENILKTSSNYFITYYGTYTIIYVHYNFI